MKEVNSPKYHIKEKSKRRHNTDRQQIIDNLFKEKVKREDDDLDLGDYNDFILKTDMKLRKKKVRNFLKLADD